MAGERILERANSSSGGRRRKSEDKRRRNEWEAGGTVAWRNVRGWFEGFWADYNVSVLFLCFSPNTETNTVTGARHGGL